MIERILVTGDRNWSDEQRMNDVLGCLEGPVVIVHGGARGADKMAAAWAERNGQEVEAHPARWDFYGRGAGPVRNQQMVDAGAHLCIAFHYDFDHSRGTADCVDRAKAAGIPVLLITEDGEHRL